MEAVCSLPLSGSRSLGPLRPRTRRMGGRGMPIPTSTSGHSGTSVKRRESRATTGSRLWPPSQRTGLPRRHEETPMRMRSRLGFAAMRSHVPREVARVNGRATRCVV